VTALRRYWGHGLLAICAALWIAQLFLPAEGVGFVTGIVVYMIAWWMVFFTVLPLRVTGQYEDGHVVPGSDPGAPTNPHMASKVWLAARVTGVIWLIYYIGFEYNLISLEAFSMFEPPARY
jgi:predicted secreted protein